MDILSWPSIGIVASIFTGAVAYIFGYPVCHSILGPYVLKKAGKRETKENFIYFGSLLVMESDLRELAACGNKAANSIVKSITVCKWLLILSIISLITFAVISAKISDL